MGPYRAQVSDRDRLYHGPESSSTLKTGSAHSSRRYPFRLQRQIDTASSATFRSRGTAGVLVLPKGTRPVQRRQATLTRWSSSPPGWKRKPPSSNSSQMSWYALASCAPGTNRTAATNGQFTHWGWCSTPIVRFILRS